MTLTFRSILATGQTGLDTGLRDILIVPMSGKVFAYATGTANGGLLALELTAGSAPRLVDSEIFAAQTGQVASGQLTLVHSGGQTLLMMGQDAGSGLVGFQINPATGTIEQAAQSDVSYATGQITATAPFGAGGYMMAHAGIGSILVQPSFSANAPLALDTPTAGFVIFINDIVTIPIGSSSFVYAISAATNGVLGWHLSPDLASASYLGHMGAGNGLGIANPVALQSVQAHGQTFLLVAASGSSSLTVFRVGTGGDLTPTDHIIDTLHTRFATTQAMATVEANGHSFVLVGGSDDGISLFSLLPDGTLLHQSTLAQATGMGLINITAIAAVQIGTEVQVIVTGEGAAGVTQLAFSVADLAPPQVGGAAADTLIGAGNRDLLAGEGGNDSLSGGAGNDTLSDGPGIDLMTGGTGSDVFVLTFDGERDVITDFDPSVDRLDLSNWPMFYDAGQLAFSSLTQGLRIGYRSEILDLDNSDGIVLTAEAIKAALWPGADRPLMFFGDEIIGYDTADLLSGSQRDDLLMGEGGDDTLLGAPGDDVLEGGAGQDILHGAEGADTLLAGAGDDTLTGGTGDDLLFGGAGTDTALLEVAYGAATVTRQADGSVRIVSDQGNDGHADIEVFVFTDRTLTLQAMFPVSIPTTGSDYVVATPENDLVLLLDGDDTLSALLGNDTLYGGRGRDVIFGDRGDDLIFGDDDADTLYGGDGNDTVYGGIGPDVVWLGAGNDRFEDDPETGANGADLVYGGLGHDTLLGGGGNDTLYGDSDNDYIEGGDGDDEIYGGWQADTLFGGLGNDTIDASFGRDIVHLGDGNDLFVDTPQSDAYAHDLIFGGAGNDTVLGLGGNETVHGDAGDDLIEGGDGDDILYGGTGNDTIRGGNQTDLIFGGDGDDRVEGGAGQDRVDLGAGHDLFVDEDQEGVYGSDLVFGGDGNDVILGRGGDDTLLGDNGNDMIEGGIGNDALYGGGHADTLYGGAGDDFIDGGIGQDLIWMDDGNDRFIDQTQTGPFGADTVYGGAGNDTIIAGGGNDLFSGGAGADVFVFNPGIEQDRITDFLVGVDTLRLHNSLTGTWNEADVIASGSVANGAFVLTFGPDSITFDGVTSSQGFEFALEIF